MCQKNFGDMNQRMHSAQSSNANRRLGESEISQLYLKRTSQNYPAETILLALLFTYHRQMQVKLNKCMLIFQLGASYLTAYVSCTFYTISTIRTQQNKQNSRSSFDLFTQQHKETTCSTIHIPHSFFLLSLIPSSDTTGTISFASAPLTISFMLLTYLHSFGL